MSTFIQLAQRLRTECAVTGTNTTVVAATGEWGRLCNWLSQAWIELQEENPQWEWMRKNVTFNTVANQGEYAPSGVEIALTDFGSWRNDSFRAYLQSAGVGNEQLLGFKDYDTFRDYYLLSTRKTTYARPTEITVTPSKTLMLGLIPNDIYVVTGEYYKTPQVLALDADTPELPTRFHMALVYKAMMSYAGYESAPEVYARGEKQYKAMLNKIRLDQSPMITRGRAMI